MRSRVIDEATIFGKVFVTLYLIALWVVCCIRVFWPVVAIITLLTMLLFFAHQLFL